MNERGDCECIHCLRDWLCTDQILVDCSLIWLGDSGVIGIVSKHDADPGYSLCLDRGHGGGG